jgi:hypothetical protein
VLDCSAGRSCPSGMQCRTASSDAGSVSLCMWPQPAGSTGTEEGSASGTAGGGETETAGEATM